MYDHYIHLLIMSPLDETFIIDINDNSTPIIQPNTSTTSSTISPSSTPICDPSFSSISSSSNNSSSFSSSSSSSSSILSSSTSSSTPSSSSTAESNASHTIILSSPHTSKPNIPEDDIFDSMISTDSGKETIGSIKKEQVKEPESKKTKRDKKKDLTDILSKFDMGDLKDKNSLIDKMSKMLPDLLTTNNKFSGLSDAKKKLESKKTIQRMKRSTTQQQEDYKKAYQELTEKSPDKFKELLEKLADSSGSDSQPKTRKQKQKEKYREKRKKNAQNKKV